VKNGEKEIIMASAKSSGIISGISASKASAAKESGEKSAKNASAA